MISRRVVAVALSAACAVWVRPGSAQQAPPATASPAALTLTLEEALALARKSAPRVLAARALAPEVDGERAEATIYPRFNPTIEAAIGPRFKGVDATPAISVEYMQVLGLGGGVSARIAALDAKLDRTKAEGEGTTQGVQRAVALAFVRTLWANERLKLAEDQALLAKETATTTDQRLVAGDSTRLEVNVAKLGIGRAAAELKDTEALRDSYHGELRLLLGLGYATPLSLQGSLGEIGKAELGAMLARAKERPELLAIASELKEAEADASYADALSYPDLGIGLRFEHEDKDTNTAMGVLSLSLPFFDHGQGLGARAEAKKRRAQNDLQQRTAELPIEIRRAFEVFQRRREAAMMFDGAAGFGENLELASKGYKAGETDLAELLLLRRELIEAKRSHTDRLLAAREAEIELRAAAGVWP